MRKIRRHWVPAVIALSVVLLTLSFAACGGSEETREDVPTATAAGETSAATSPTVDAAGGTPEFGPSHSDAGCRAAKHFLREPLTSTSGMCAVRQ